MKRFLLTLALAIPLFGVTNAQDKPYKVVFDLTSTDTLNQMALTRMIVLIAETSPEAQIEVVMYGKGFEIVMPGKSQYLDDVRKSLENPNVSYVACEMAMKKHKVDKSMFVEGVGTVPDGIKELVQKQAEGWGYVKVSR